VKLASILAVSLALAGAVGCSADKQEAKRVAAAIGRMRDARGPAREPLLAALEQMAIEGKEAKAARDACVVVYRALSDANRKLDAAKEQLRSRDETKGQGLDNMRQGLADVKKAQQGIEACVVAVQTLETAIR